MSTRRTRTLRLALMGTIGLVGTLPLAGCDEAPEAQAFRTAEECISKTGQDLMCREAEQQAQAAAQQNAPAFRSQQACEAAFGSCAPAPALPSREQADAAAGMGDRPAATTASGAGSWFMPAAAGFLLGRALGGPPSPYFMRRDGGAVAFAGGRQQPINPNWFQDPQQQQRQSNWSSRTGSSSSSYYRGTTSRSGGSVTSSPSRTGGFGTTARSSGSSSSS
jgi:uncharacterized protein YgiB involved in biofilm formation